jgi:hypothetical protein
MRLEFVALGHWRLILLFNASQEFYDSLKERGDGHALSGECSEMDVRALAIVLERWRGSRGPRRL